jgi:hypothetical protein
VNLAARFVKGDFKRVAGLEAGLNMKLPRKTLQQIQVLPH